MCCEQNLCEQKAEKLVHLACWIVNLVLIEGQIKFVLLDVSIATLTSSSMLNSQRLTPATQAKITQPKPIFSFLFFRSLHNSPEFPLFCYFVISNFFGHISS
jgi:hypothetical protein